MQTQPIITRKNNCTSEHIQYKERTGGLWEGENHSPPRDGAQTVRYQEEEALPEEQTHDGRPAMRMWPSATGLVIHGPQAVEQERTGGP